MQNCLSGSQGLIIVRAIERRQNSAAPYPSLNFAAGRCFLDWSHKQFALTLGRMVLLLVL